MGSLTAGRTWRNTQPLPKGNTGARRHRAQGVVKLIGMGQRPDIVPGFQTHWLTVLFGRIHRTA